MISSQKSLQLIYAGSVKKVFAKDSSKLLFEFTDDYSVFDWGKMPDTILNKGKALALMGAYFFEILKDNKLWQALPASKHLQRFDSQWLSQYFSCDFFKELQKKGAHHHFVSLLDEDGQSLSLNQAAESSKSIYMEVKKAEVLQPTQTVVLNQTVFEYPAVDPAIATRLIPLEVVFRFGMPAGSSLKSRLEKDADYAGQLGFTEIPKENSWFKYPVIEFFTKLEPKDRLLSCQEALLISGLTSKQFNDLIAYAQGLALALFSVFADSGIELWDGKFEFILDKGKLLLADSIGPDELRLIYQNCHLSKEMIRQFYRDSKWYKAIGEAQKLAKHRAAADWKDICQKELKESPELLSKDFKSIINKLYGALTNHICKNKLFKDEISLSEFVSQANGLEKSK